MTTAALSGITFDEETHTYRDARGVVPGVTRILETANLRLNIDLLPWAVRDAAKLKGELGRAVHAAAHYLDEGDLSWGSVADEVFGYLEGWERYKRERKFITIHPETRLYSARYRYAGTSDRIGLVEDRARPVLADLKIGDPRDAGGGYQTAAYENAAREMGLIDGPIDRECVQLFPDGTYKVHPCDRKTDFNVFLAALTIYQEKNR